MVITAYRPSPGEAACRFSSGATQHALIHPSHSQDVSDRNTLFSHAPQRRNTLQIAPLPSPGRPFAAHSIAGCSRQRGARRACQPLRSLGLRP